MARRKPIGTQHSVYIDPENSLLPIPIMDCENLKPSYIFGRTSEFNDYCFFMIKWKDVDLCTFVPADVVVRKYPILLANFYKRMPVFRDGYSHIQNLI